MSEDEMTKILREIKEKLEKLSKDIARAREENRKGGKKKNGNGKKKGGSP